MRSPVARCRSRPEFDYRHAVRLSFVSDVHGNIDALAAVARRAERLVVLGDLVDYVDYDEPAGGIMGRAFGENKVRHFIMLRTTGQFQRLREYNRELWDSTTDPLGTLNELVSEVYRGVLAAVGPDCLLTLGNVDVAAVWNQVAGEELRYLDQDVVEVAGRRLGFVGGGSGRPGSVFRRPDHAWQPFVRPPEEFAAAVDGLGPVDILCSHIPPGIPELRYDVVAARLEMYGPRLLEAIEQYQPAFAMFGHVHQPLARRTRRGVTECINVGYFRRFPEPFELDLR